MRPLVPVLLAAVAAAPAQQLSFAVNDGPAYADTTTGGRDWAFRFTANAPVLVAAQVFTGNTQSWTHAVTIFSRDPVTGRPDQPISLPAQFSVTSARCWQGATFPVPVQLSIGVDYFLFWHGGFSQHSYAPWDPVNPPLMSEVHQSIGGVWLLSGMGPAKFRLFAPYAAGTTSAYGAGKAGEFGVPAIGLQGWPALGSPIDVWLADAARQVPAVLVLGTPIPNGLPLGFAHLFVTPDVLLVQPTVTNFPTLSPLMTGGATTTVLVPNVPNAVGFPLSFQVGRVRSARARRLQPHERRDRTDQLIAPTLQPHRLRPAPRYVLPSSLPTIHPCVTSSPCFSRSPWPRRPFRRSSACSPPTTTSRTAATRSAGRRA